MNTILILNQESGGREGVGILAEMKSEETYTGQGIQFITLRQVFIEIKSRPAKLVTSIIRICLPHVHLRNAILGHSLYDLIEGGRK